MRKLLAIITALVLLLVLGGCNPNNTESINKTPQSTNKVISYEQMLKKYTDFFDLSTDGGLTVYIWQMSESDYRCYLINTHIDESSDQSFAFENGATIEEMRFIISTYNMDKKDITIRTEINPLSSYYYEIDDEYRAKVKDLFWNDIYNNLMYTTVVKEGSDVEGVTISFKNIYFEGEKPYIKVEWKNDTENEFVYGESFELEYLNGRQFESCAKDEVYFNSLGYILPAKSTKTEDYNLSQFDISKSGAYKFKVRYSESKYLWIVFNL